MWHKQSVELKGDHSCDEPETFQTGTNCVVDIDTLICDFSRKHTSPQLFYEIGNTNSPVKIGRRRKTKTYQ